MARDSLELDLLREYPQLSTPPIAEAVIHWQARAQAPLQDESVASKFAHEFPDYPSVEPIQLFEFAAAMKVNTEPDVSHKHGWHGYRLTSADKRNVIQFTRDGLVFSRIEKYDGWTQFSSAAKLAWRAFVEIAKPVEISRLGVRFINRFPGASTDTLGEYLKEPPHRPANLPLKGFFIQSTLSVPGYPYGVRFGEMIQSRELDGSRGSELLLDIDVYTNLSLPPDDSTIDSTLDTMRRIKNIVFFSTLTEPAIERLR